MTKEYCYYHEGDKATTQCDSCGKHLCDDCTNSYWQTNTIAGMFQAQKQKQEEKVLCISCLRKVRIRNGLFSGLLLILILGTISYFIVIGVT